MQSSFAGLPMMLGFLLKKEMASDNFPNFLCIIILLKDFSLSHIQDFSFLIVLQISSSNNLVLHLPQLDLVKVVEKYSLTRWLGIFHFHLPFLLTGHSIFVVWCGNNMDISFKENLLIIHYLNSVL